MSGSSSVPRPVFGPLGLDIPAEADVLAGVNLDMNAAFGGNLNTGTADGGETNPTPQGQLAGSTTAIIGDKNALYLRLTQQVDPAFADGRMQDGIARIYFIERNPALGTVVTATCTGLVNTPIPAGALAKAADGTLYTADSGGTIPLGGSIDLQFTAATTGPIACPAGSLTTISQAINGWDTITNAADGIVGVNVETRAAFETRRGQSVAKNSVGSVASILGAVLSVDGLLDAYVTANDTGSPATIGGITIGANQLYVAAAGGTDQDVATAIWTKKMPGGPYYAGNTSVTVLDQNSLYSLPFPSYLVKFQRPTGTPIFFVVWMTNTAAVPSGALMEVQNAVLAAFAGTDGGLRARIGSTIYQTRYVGGIAALGVWAQIIRLQVGTGAAASFTGSIAGTVLTVSAVASGALAQGQLLTGALIAQGTLIGPQLTGSAGSTGTYTVTISQTISSEPLVTVALVDSVSMTIAQAPATSAGDINLILV